ncbi:hypothetical protein [Aneurinibacillus aneurinilyticus]|uniref:hypothetical protein n=1 Tax=Aneurinibacillus aneurinilyticus TaxID=1391 RepID=UPI0023F528A3|nr:hypothetical protein [Aneurinibacillus aneurinilyticus]
METKQLRNLRFHMNLQHFAEPTTDPEPSAEPAAEPKTSDNEPHKQPEGKTIPYDRFKAVNDDLKTFKETFKELGIEGIDGLKSLVTTFTELKQTNVEVETVKTKAETYEQRVQQLEGVIEQLLETRLVNVPEEFHDLIPADYTAEQKLEWITAAEAKGLFGKKRHQQIGGETNALDKQTTDLNTLSPIQLLKFGYGTK